jgi:hypothetical protein
MIKSSRRAGNRAPLHSKQVAEYACGDHAPTLASTVMRSRGTALSGVPEGIAYTSQHWQAPSCRNHLVASDSDYVHGSAMCGYAYFLDERTRISSTRPGHLHPWPGFAAEWGAKLLSGLCRGGPSLDSSPECSLGRESQDRDHRQDRDVE